jgi:hypothetical protein
MPLRSKGFTQTLILINSIVVFYLLSPIIVFFTAAERLYRSDRYRKTAASTPYSVAEMPLFLA